MIFWICVYVAGAILANPILWVTNLLVVLNNAYFMGDTIESSDLQVIDPHERGINIVLAIFWPPMLVFLSFALLADLITTWVKASGLSTKGIVSSINIIAARRKDRTNG